MDEPQRATGSGALEVAEDFALQRKQWRVERALWAVMGLVAAAALLGGFGRGWLSHGRAVGDGVVVEFDRLPHVETETLVVVRWGPGAGDSEERVRAGPAEGAEGDAEKDGGEVVLVLPAGYLERVRVERVEPEPSRTEVSASETRYILAARGGGVARLTVTPMKVGRMGARVRVGSGEAEVSQFVMP
ncbi:MAG: hypothetical protein WD749_13410 [Phycisphaerales bacterium]